MFAQDHSDGPGFRQVVEDPVPMAIVAAAGEEKSTSEGDQPESRRSPAAGQRAASISDPLAKRQSVAAFRLHALLGN